MSHFDAFLRQPWMDDAACIGVDPDLWFPDLGPGSRIAARRAREICDRCPVQAACLEYALTNNELGIWGGLTEPERAELAQARGVDRGHRINHGTIGGYRAHYRRGEQPCDACRQAHRAYQQDRARRAESAA